MAFYMVIFFTSNFPFLQYYSTYSFLYLQYLSDVLYTGVIILLDYMVKLYLLYKYTNEINTVLQTSL